MRQRQREWYNAPFRQKAPFSLKEDTVARIAVVADVSQETDTIVRMLERDGDVVLRVESALHVQHVLESTGYDLVLIQQHTPTGSFAVTLVRILQMPAHRFVVYGRESDADHLQDLRWQAQGYAGYCQFSAVYPDLFGAHVAIFLYRRAA